MGQGIAIALAAAGRPVTLLARSPRPVIHPLTLDARPWAAAVGDASIVLIATPDDAVEAAAQSLAEEGAVQAKHAVLHLSGLLDRAALAPLESTGAALGSFHPLQTISDPRSAPHRLAGAWAGVEGDPRARRAGEEVARMLGMRAVQLQAASKPLYHAAAVIAGNAPAVLAALAERLAQAAGIAPELAASMYLPLIAGAVENLRAAGPAAALTGPVRRGDVDTVRRHLAALPAEAIPIYRLLGLEAVALATLQGLDSGAARALRRLLRPSSPDT